MWQVFTRILPAGLAGIEMMHMIRKRQLMLKGGNEMSFADQFYPLAGQIRPV
nr:hypothetical protein [Polaromonas sp. UBA4122]